VIDINLTVPSSLSPSIARQSSLKSIEQIGRLSQLKNWAKRIVEGARNFPSEKHTPFSLNHRARFGSIPRCTMPLTAANRLREPPGGPAESFAVHWTVVQDSVAARPPGSSRSRFAIDCGAL
jgi:hypothetical protein